MVVFDATVLIDLFNPRLNPDRKAKLDHLLAELQRKKTKIVIPTPALAEFLARAGKARDAYHEQLSSQSSFRIGSFDNRAALECALLLDAVLSSGDKRSHTRPGQKPSSTGRSSQSRGLPTLICSIQKTPISRV